MILPKNRPPTHPGEMLLKEFLEPMNMTQQQFAKHLNWPYVRLNEIVNGRRGVSADSALAFSEALGTNPEFWVNLQNAWDLWRAQKIHKVVEKLDLVHV